MDDQSQGKGRVIMLALSGLLFGASGLMWFLQSHPTKTPVATVATPEVTPAPAETVATRPLEPQMPTYRATTRDEAVAAAREAIRPNPLAPLAHHSEPVYQQQPVQQVPPPPNLSGGFVPPPPAYDPRNVAWQPPVTEEPPHDKLTVSDVRLVGIIESKAIFKISRSAAEQFNLPRSFTLGVGESFSNMKLKSVERESATIADGAEVATKELPAVH